MTDKKAHLTVDGLDAAIELPIYNSSTGPDVIDVTSITKNGFFTFDPGFMSTASCESKITFIDGDKGILLHRGYPIDQLADHSDYLETCYLLLNGELPNDTQKQEFTNAVKNHSAVDPSVAALIKTFKRDAHPMAILCSAVAALAAVYNEGIDITKEEDRKVTAQRLIGQMPTLAAMVYKHSQGEEFIAPDSALGYAENYLNMTFGKAGQASKVSQVLAKAMDRIFYSSCGPRAKCINVNGTPLRFFRHQPVCRYRSGHCNFVGTSSRRSQRSGIKNAGRNRQRGQH